MLEARDGEEALLVAAAEEQPDLVVLPDFGCCPSFPTSRLRRRLRGRQETRNVPIIMLTARGEESRSTFAAWTPAPTIIITIAPFP